MSDKATQLGLRLFVFGSGLQACGCLIFVFPIIALLLYAIVKVLLFGAS